MFLLCSRQLALATLFFVVSLYPIKREMLQVGGVLWEPEEEFTLLSIKAWRLGEMTTGASAITTSRFWCICSTCCCHTKVFLPQPFLILACQCWLEKEGRWIPARLQGSLIFLICLSLLSLYNAFRGLVEQDTGVRGVMPTISPQNGWGPSCLNEWIL